MLKCPICTEKGSVPSTYQNQAQYARAVEILTRQQVQYPSTSLDIDYDKDAEFCAPWTPLGQLLGWNPHGIAETTLLRNSIDEEHCRASSRDSLADQTTLLETPNCGVVAPFASVETTRPPLSLRPLTGNAWNTTQIPKEEAIEPDPSFLTPMDIRFDYIIDQGRELTANFLSYSANVGPRNRQSSAF